MIYTFQIERDISGFFNVLNNIGIDICRSTSLFFAAMNKITKSYTYCINKGATMSEEFEKKGPGTDNKAFVPEDEGKTKSFDSMVNEKMEQSDYTGYGFKEVT